MSVLKNKVLLLVGLVLLALFIFVFSEENVEYGSEFPLWKINFDEIIYQSPKEEWQGKDKERFHIGEVKLSRKGSFLTRYIFTIEFKDKESGENVIYEGGYNIRNLFTELSIPKIRSVILNDTTTLKQLGIDQNHSPMLLMHSGNDVKKMILGDKSRDSSNRYFIVDSKGIYAIHSYIFEKFTMNPINWRERQLISVADKYIKKVELIDSDFKKYTLINSPMKINNNEMSNWSRISQNKENLSKQDSQKVDNEFRTLRTDLFPDETDGQGFAVAKIVTGFPVNEKIKVTFADNSEIEIDFYPPTEIKKTQYIPFRRKVNELFFESPGYLKRDKFNKILEIVQGNKK